MGVDPYPSAEPSLASALYTDDVVADRDDPSRVGVITRTAWEDEEEGEDDEDGEEEEEDEVEEEDDEEGDGEPRESAGGAGDDGGARAAAHVLPPAHARVLWLPSAAHPLPRVDPASPHAPPSLSSIHPVSGLTLVDRSLLHGDVVVRADDPLGLLGSVVDAQVQLMLAMVNSAEVRSEVPSTAVTPVHEFQSGVHVTKEEGRLLGWVDDCVVDVQVRFADGAECRVHRCRNRDLQDAVWEQPDDDEYEEDERGERKSQLWYPGQQVKGRPAVWRQAEWLKGTKASAQRANNLGIISRVTPVAVRVQWLSGVGQVEEEHSECSPAELQLLGAFEASRIMLGDHVLLPVAAEGARGMEQKDAASSAAATEEAEGDDDAEEAADTASASSSASAATSPSAPLSAAAKRRLTRERAARRRQEDDVQRCARVVRTRTTVSVQWQNGVREDGVSSTSLLPRSDLVDNDFLPNDFVLVRGSQRLAVVLAVEPSQRTAEVLFLATIADDVVRPAAEDESEEAAAAADGASDPAAAPESAPNPLGPRLAGERASVSIFDCVAHPRLELSVSSLVVRIPGLVDGSDAEVPYGTAGQVLSMAEGRLTVQWGNPARLVSSVQPDQVWNVDQPDEAGLADDGDYEDEEEDEEEDDPELSAFLDDMEVVPVEDARQLGEVLMDQWRQMEQQGRARRRAQRRNQATVEEIQPGEEDEQQPQQQRPPQRQPQPAAGHAAAEQRGSGPAGADDEDAQDGHADDEGDEGEEEDPAVDVAAVHGPVVGSVSLFSLNLCPSPSTAASSAEPQSTSSAPPTASSASPPPAAAAEHEEQEEEEEDESSSVDLASLLSRPPASASSFSSFSVLPRPSSSHHFLSSHPSPSTSAAFVRAARSEHRLLSEHLPHGIHVLTYESRVDLLRCAIAGPATTPYYESLFLFDILLPAAYPNVPPVLHYHARGLRLNPNLYAEGKGQHHTPPHSRRTTHNNAHRRTLPDSLLWPLLCVASVCLSLLNTWSGRGVERWSASSSTLLQVLLSLQGLVLGDAEPFFLEAGYESKRRTATHCAVASVQYNETALLLALSLDAAQLSQMDPEWAPLVQSHFAAPHTLSLFRNLQTAVQQLSAAQTTQRTAEEEQLARSTLHLFSIPMGKALWEGPAPPAGGQAAASAAAQPSLSADSQAAAAGDGDLAGTGKATADSTAEEAKEDDEKQRAAPAATAPLLHAPAPPSSSSSSSAPPPSLLPYTPSSGFLSALSRHLHRLHAALNRNTAALAHTAAATQAAAR